MTDVATTSLPAVQMGAPSSGGLLANPGRFEFGQRAANLFASSQLIPAALRGKPADCFIGLHMAERMNEDPLTVLQNIVIVKGNAGWKAQYMIARANASGVFKGRIKWRVTGAGDAMSVVAYATLAETGEEVASPAIDMKMAKAEGWTQNAKYQSMPEVMLRYRAATFLVRFNCPEVMLGMQTAEEVEDLHYAGAPRPSVDGGYEPVDGGELVATEADPFEQAAAGAKLAEAKKPAQVTAQEPSAAATSEAKSEPQNTGQTELRDEWADVPPADWPGYVERGYDMIDACKSQKDIEVLLAQPKFAFFHAAEKYAPKSHKVLAEEIEKKRKELGR